jgi:hypothetical protein
METTQPPEAEDPRRTLRLTGGRDELNLAEFPITLLTDRVPQGCKTLVFEDSVYDQQAGETVRRKVTVTGSDAHGLPTALDDEILVALIQLTRLANDFTEPRVSFTRYELIRLLGWPDDGKSYRRVEESLHRWMGVTLFYDKAWWNREAQAWVSETFHILENVSLVDRSTRRRPRARGREERALSSFTWNQVVFRSFRTDNLKRLDLDAYFALQSAVAKRLFRFLDKRFYHRRRWEFDLKEFAFEHIGLSRSYADSGRIKGKLDPALEELTAIGFLEPLDRARRYVRVRQGQWRIVLVQKPAAPSGAAPPTPEPSELERTLIDRGVTPATAAGLAAQHPADAVRAKVEVFDWLAGRKDRRLGRNPAGYLVQSIRDDYAAPPGFESRADRLRREEAERRARQREAERHRLRKAEQAREAAEHAQVMTYWNALGPAEQARLEADALAGADASLQESYRGSRGTPLEPMARRLIREEHIKRLLGLAEASLVP